MLEIREYRECVRAPKNCDLDKLMVFDLECVKVPSITPGWPTKLRTKPIMLGYGYWVSRTELKVRIIAGNDEREFIDAAAAVFNSFDIAVYYATRDYDKNVLEGKWTYARRELWTKPVKWPTFKGYNGYKNCYREVQNKVDYRIDRTGDIPSKDVIYLWPAGIYDPVFYHNKIDVVEIANFVRYLSE